ncbi:MAG: hypothetical protein STSR0004_22630 [Peptococcaceae bacterium]
MAEELNNGSPIIKVPAGFRVGGALYVWPVFQDNNAFSTFRTLYVTSILHLSLATNFSASLFSFSSVYEAILPVIKAQVSGKIIGLNVVTGAAIKKGYERFPGNVAKCLVEHAAK